MDLDTPLRVYIGLALVAVSRRMSRAGFGLLADPSTQKGRPGLRVVGTDDRAASDAANVHDIRRRAL